MKNVYLANPYGFSKQQTTLLTKVIETLKAISPDITVWEPFSRNNQIDFTDPDSGYLIGRADRNDVQNCDAVFAITNGVPPDDGVAIEVGIAIAHGKPVFLFRDDFRSYQDRKEYPLNLMWFCGHPKGKHMDYYYTSLDEIGDPDKAFSQWARS